MLNYRQINFLFLAFALFLLVLNSWFPVKWWYFVVLFAVRFLILVIGSSFIQLNFHVKAHCSNTAEKDKKIALTFDDGPSPVTLQVLDILKKHQAKAAFFCIGKHIENHPEILKRLVEEGHIIGNHSYSHSHFFDFYGKNKILAELQETDALIHKITGRKPAFFRPPYGVTNPAIRKALAASGHKVIGWNIRSMDGISHNEGKIFRRIARQLQPGSVVLLHDTSENSVRVLERLLLFLQANHYQVVPIDELLNLKPYEE